MFVENLKKCLNIFSKVYVSSDSQVILDKARLIGAHPIFRPQRLCGETPNIPVYRHAAEKMGKVNIVAVQANSPTLDPNLILVTKGLLELGVSEIMTCHPNRTIYGSVWGISPDRLAAYVDFYHSSPEALLVDNSIDIHQWSEYEEAIKWAENNPSYGGTEHKEK